MQSIAEAAGPNAKPLHQMTPEEARALGRSLADAAGPAPPMARVEEHTLEREGGRAGPGSISTVPIIRPARTVPSNHASG